MKMNKNKQKGFTLTELIIVIVIIGILAAVLIPSISGYIKKAKISNDVSDCKNMNTVLSAYAAENNINLKKLEAPEVRYIVSIDNKNYTFKPNYKEGVFWYNKKEGKIEYSSKGLTGEIKADSTYDPESIEEIRDGYLYLNTTGELANALLKLRNLSNRSDYESLKTNSTFEGIDISAILEKYDPVNTLFISSSLGYTDSLGTESNLIKNIVFGDNLVVMPALGINRNLRIDENVKITLPLSLRVVMEGALTKIKSSNRITTKSVNQKIQYIPGSLSAQLENKNNVEYTLMDEISKNIVENCTLLSFEIGSTTFTIEKENEEYVLKQNGTKVDKGLNYSGNLTVTVNLAEDKNIVVNDKNKLSVITKKLFAKYSDVDALNITYEVKNKEANAIIRAFNNSGMIINIILVYNLQ